MITEQPQYWEVWRNDIMGLFVIITTAMSFLINTSISTVLLIGRNTTSSNQFSLFFVSLYLCNYFNFLLVFMSSDPSDTTDEWRKRYETDLSCWCCDSISFFVTQTYMIFSLTSQCFPSKVCIHEYHIIQGIIHL